MNLFEPGERVRTPAQPLLQKKSCFIDDDVIRIDSGMKI